MAIHKALLRLALLGSLGSFAPRGAESLDCARGIVSVGDSRLDLVAKCGAPALFEAGDVSLAIERFTYNFGPGRFIEVVSLQGGRIFLIEQGGYGYPFAEPVSDSAWVSPSIPRARCDPEVLRPGRRTFEVLTACGEPFSRDLRPGQAEAEIWTYDFGPWSFVRHLEFEGGQLTRIRTGSYGYSQG